MVAKGVKPRRFGTGRALSLHIQLERFEGPMGLLLHLIRKEEMDIFDINIHQITRQYLDYIKAMRRLDLEMAGEFVAMAATLIHIKSRMLLPQYNEDGEEIESEDPRKELVQKLLEYQKYQEASHKLYERPLVGRDIWLRGHREDLEASDEGDIIVEDNPLFSLISAYRSSVKKMKTSVHRVMGELQSIASRIMEIKDRLLVGTRVRLHDLVTETEKTRDQLLVTFLSMLELAKMGFVSLFQNESYSDLHIEAKMPIEDASVSQVENYESAYNDEPSKLQMAVDLFSAFESTEEEVKDPSAAQMQQMEEIEVSEDQIAESFAHQEEALDEEGQKEDPLVQAATDEEIEQEELKLAEEERAKREGRPLDEPLPPEGELI